VQKQPACRRAGGIGEGMSRGGMSGGEMSRANVSLAVRRKLEHEYCRRSDGLCLLPVKRRDAVSDVVEGRK